MLNKSFLVLFSMLLGLAFFVPSNALAATKASVQKDYDYELVDQQPATHLTMQPSEVKTVWIEVKNTGKKTWYSGTPRGINDLGFGFVNVATGSKYDTQQRGKDYHSEFNNYIPSSCVGCNYDWLCVNRPATISLDAIKPGWNTRFQFTLKAPQTPGIYREYITPVVDGVEWMKDIGIYWEIHVVPPDGHYLTTTNINLEGGDKISRIRIGDSAYMGISSAFSDNVNFDNKILQYVGRTSECGGYTIDVESCNKNAKSASYEFRGIANGMSKVTIGDSSPVYISVGGGTYYYANAYFTDETHFSLKDVKAGSLILVTLKNPGDGGYVFNEPEFPAGRVRLLDSKHFNATSGLMGDFGSDQWVFEILDSNISNYIQIRAYQPWTGGNSFTDFLLNINPVLPCASGTTGCAL